MMAPPGAPAGVASVRGRSTGLFFSKETFMRFFQGCAQFYCGIDLHTKAMYLCILNAAGRIVLHKNLPTRPDAFLDAVKPYREELVVGAECVFPWYWLADLCSDEGIEFVLGHALYMKAIHGGKAKNDRIDSEKIARLLRGGTFPLAYVYPASMWPTRDLLRRRTYLVRRRAEAMSHIQNTNTQYNLPSFAKRIDRPSNRVGIAERFEDPCVRANMQIDLDMLDQYDRVIRQLELHLVRRAKIHDATTYHLLRTVNGIGKVLALVLMYEIHDIGRFPRVQDFVSYCRLIKCDKESAGKKYGYGGKKIGNAHLKWAFSEATVLMMRYSDEAKKFVEGRTKKHGKGKAMSILSARIGRAVYFMLKRRLPFEPKLFFAH